ncbi:MAG: translation initiation factor IF-2 N-terminal domain-containing protein, partial [Terracidiphilus sp.]
MSKVRINDLAKELEVKSRAILDILPELGVPAGKTHSSSLEGDEAEKVRARLGPDSRQAAHGSASGRQSAASVVPKIDLSHISKPGDVLKAILAKKQEEEAEARHGRVPAKPAAPPAQPAKPVVHAAPAAPPIAATPARPEPRKIVPQPRQAAPIVATPTAPPAIASRPPTGAVVA